MSPSADFVDFAAHHQPCGASEHVDAVVVLVAVEGGLAAGRDFVVPQAKVDGAVAFADHDLPAAAHGAIGVVCLDRDAFPRVLAVFTRKSVQYAHIIPL